MGRGVLASTVNESLCFQHIHTSLQNLNMLMTAVCVYLCAQCVYGVRVQ